MRRNEGERLARRPFVHDDIHNHMEYLEKKLRREWTWKNKDSRVGGASAHDAKGIVERSSQRVLPSDSPRLESPATARLPAGR